MDDRNAGKPLLRLYLDSYIDLYWDLHLGVKGDAIPASARQIGQNFNVKDGRTAALHNSGFGTVYGIVDGKPLPVCDYAGYAPFGFGYRRCPGGQLTVHMFADFLRKVWTSKIAFEALDVADPESLPIGPGTVMRDTVGFIRAT